jgi:very-short-patch-repair endonuclease
MLLFFLAVIVVIVIAIKAFSSSPPAGRAIETSEVKVEAEVESAPDKHLPYLKKRYILTSAEYRFYKALHLATGDQFIIAPQVHLEGLIEVDHREHNWRTYHNKIDRKSVDFVLFDKQTVVALLAIELDDSSHRRPDRQERDGFVNSIFASAGLKLLHVPVREYYPVEELRAQIGRLLLSSPTAPPKES